MARGDLRRAAVVIAAIVVALAVLMGVSGMAVFTNAKVDQLQRADAVVVLGGEHDGREDYGIELARGGWAPTVVISDAYAKDDPVMDRVCKPQPAIEVICARAPQMNTRGEAQMVHRLAAKRSWKKIIVVTWRYHLPRARLIFRQCFSPDPDAVVMQAVPRRYDYSLARWQFIYAYQYAAFAKAAAMGDCRAVDRTPSSSDRAEI
ncbi:YdcF family protein [Mycobacterium sp. NPDC048908]|uniref:YdcF family protein n=1 Tax=Mycobacterium sp. NPDC048908 TaxID=3364292 RepID=UPI0037128218